jgi:hypothetical protein
MLLACPCRLHLNKYTKCIFAHLDYAISVSFTCRENLVLRSSIPPEQIFVIPNAVDPASFTPDISLRHPLVTLLVHLLKLATTYVSCCIVKHCTRSLLHCSGLDALESSFRSCRVVPASISVSETVQLIVN